MYVNYKNKVLVKVSDKMKIKNIIKNICIITIIFSMLMNFFLPILNIPSFVKGILIVCDLMFLLYNVFNIKKIIKYKYVNHLFTVLLLLLFFSFISFFINGYSIKLFFLGFWKTLRFFSFFITLCLVFDIKDVSKIIKIDNIMLILNIIIVLYEIFYMNLSRDYLSGTFAYANKGGNTGLISLFIIELCVLFNVFLYNKTSILKFIISLCCILGVAAIAELKIVFVVFTIVVFLSIIINKKGKKTMIILVIGTFILFIGINVLTTFYPEWKNTFSISGIYNNLFNDEFGYSSKNDISRGRAFSQINDMFYKDKPINKMIGFGMGNCDSFRKFNLYSSFYLKYEPILHYDWFTHSMVYLELGIIGFGLFLSFFIINIVNVYRITKDKKNNDKQLLYAVMCFSVFCIISIWYDSFLRIEYSYFAYAFLSIPYVINNNKNDNNEINDKENTKNKNCIGVNMKKIGIMSMQRIVNYGSFLQAYALKKTIESLGYNVEFVDYHIGNSLIKNEKLIKKYINKIKKVFYFNDYLNNKSYNTHLVSVYKDSILKYLSIKDERNYPYNKIDELVIGSDEVFNCMQGFPVCYSKELYGYNYNIPVISYAACFGNTSISDLKEKSVDKEIGKMLNKFKAISVRDENTYKIVKELTKKDISYNLDPVLIYDFSNDTITNGYIKNYILIYAYASRLTKKEKKYIKKFAKEKNKKIVSIGSYQEIADYNLVLDPFDIIPFFKRADFIITDTFHGSIFSIKTNSNFCTIIRNGSLGNSNKLIDLLKRLKMTDRIINNIKDINSMYNNKPDYKETNKIIKRGKRIALDYLRKNLI